MLKVKVIDIKDRSSLQNAADVLKKGGILVFPTDTVYGIGCILNQEAIKKLYKIKKRSLTQPTAILLTKNNSNKLRSSIKSHINEFLTGRVTVVINVNKTDINTPKVLTKDNKIGIRIPNYLWLQKLIHRVGPIVASSANKKGEPAPKKFEEISPQIIKEVNLTIKTSEKMSGIPSTVYDIEENKIIRA